ncbi:MULTISPECIES: helix-turn-helix transcriptional regulator [unclassified Saccharopolyspora]|uniref:helix-turn-helix domain-containing protein n=1 Tax=unclassified Saccharopolyspora TaxID=2646250 RepID=UPI001CD5FE28|nr:MULTISPECIES: helix-turn-helix transcriptional regulator [unclassified Saccharopolyspora]MCA1189388.1 helix-turn-helix domain-containing protein [Saccharopolyspora sp. 6T]MCA1194104.1 helix-turn-helix domain-containing protein [Saccharopolyspora sp. 6V]MCA1227516.1 helix-turn-helix domain-containing protein [Saccharopolyspora sp. 6M]MCA1281010.1 helix-turn-helix domain-containing protein [Saccharopolyspora sp. 7B]
MTVSPTVRRRRLAAELRRLRGLAEVTQQQAATHLGCTQAKIGRFETAKRSPSIGDVSALLDFYAVNGAEREQLINLARDARKRGWWHSYSDVLPEWYETYVGLEAEASSMHTWESEAIPGLLQTAEYAYAITKSTLIRADEPEISRRVELRMQRQDRITGSQPLDLWAVIGETALRRGVGGSAVLRRQLEHLLALAELPNVTLQVMPLDAGAHPAQAGPFVILRYSNHVDPDVVYLETHVGGLYLERDNELSKYVTMMDHLRAHAIDPEGSIQVIHERIGEL